MTLTVPLMPDLAVVPVFKYHTCEDLPASEKAGRAVYKTFVAVQVQYGGNNGRSYSPVFPADAISHREGHRSVTYAERWAKQYSEFMSGATQHASGTPLEELRPFGITEAQLSMCRALRVYTIEALAQLDGGTGKSLGMFSNDLMAMTRKWEAKRNSGSELADELAALKARLAELEANPISLKEPDGDADALKDKYAEITGSRPRGNPSIETLRRMVAEAEAGK
jgi:hypothetical protein